jgi:hypothetical protein
VRTIERKISLEGFLVLHGADPHWYEITLRFLAHTQLSTTLLAVNPCVHGFHATFANNQYVIYQGWNGTGRVHNADNITPPQDRVASTLLSWASVESFPSLINASSLIYQLNIIHHLSEYSSRH